MNTLMRIKELLEKMRNLLTIIEVLLVLSSIVGFLACLTLSIVSAITKNGKAKKWVIGVTICFAGFIFALTIPSRYSPLYLFILISYIFFILRYNGIISQRDYHKYLNALWLKEFIRKIMLNTVKFTAKFFSSIISVISALLSAHNRIQQAIETDEKQQLQKILMGNEKQIVSLFSNKKANKLLSKEVKLEVECNCQVCNHFWCYGQKEVNDTLKATKVKGIKSLGTLVGNYGQVLALNSVTKDIRAYQYFDKCPACGSIRIEKGVVEL